MRIEQIKTEFGEQVDSGRVFIIKTSTNDGNRYTLHIAQQIVPKVDLELNNAQPIIKTGFHHGVPASEMKKYGYTPGMLLHPQFNLSVWHSYNPQYKTQSPRRGPGGAVMTRDGMEYYEHVKLEWGAPTIDLWVSDQYLEKQQYEAQRRQEAYPQDPDELEEQNAEFNRAAQSFEDDLPF